MKHYNIYLAELDAGGIYNVIPGNGKIKIAIKNKDVDKVLKTINNYNAELKELYKDLEKNIEVVAQEAFGINKVLSLEESFNIIGSINSLYNGLLYYNFDYDLPESSSNLGAAEIKNGVCTIGVMTRSPYLPITERILSGMSYILERNGFRMSQTNGLAPG